MALAETARLVTELSLRDQLTPGLARARGALASASGAAATAGTRIGGLSGIAAGASSAFGTFSGRVSGLVKGVGLLAGTGGVLGLGAGLASSVTKAKDFAQAMELVHTQAGASQSEVENLTKSLLALAPAVGTTPELLAAGLFHVESAGFRGAKALEVLKIAAEGAKVGNANLEGVTNALVAAVNSGIGGVKDISEAMGVLNGVVGAGNLRMEDLAQAFGTGILSTAKSFGISIQSVGAAIADMASQGIPAIDAATRLRMTISLLGAPTAGAVTELKKIGLSSTQLAKDMRTPGGILTAVQDLKDHLDKSGLSAVDSAALISRAFGGGRTSSAILTLLGSVDKLKTAQDQIGKSAGSFGEAWNKTVQEADFKFESFKATMDATLIRVGNVLLPTITDALGALGNWASTHGEDITRFAEGAVGFARTAAGTIKTVFGALSAAWNLIPPWVRDFLVKGLIADRTVKFLFGFSPAKMVLSFATNTIAGLFGKIAVNRLAPQNIFATQPIPVFVTNPGFGLGGGGGPLAAGEDAAAMGGLRGLINKIPLAVVGAIDVAAIAGVVAAKVQYNQTVQGGMDFEQNIVGSRARANANNLDELVKLQKSLQQQVSAGGGNPFLDVIKGIAVNPALIDQMKQIQDRIDYLRAHPEAQTSKPGAINPATVSDYALRHPSVQKTPPPITAAEFEKILKTTPFIGSAQYKSIFEQFTSFKGGGRGLDPTGSTFLAIVQRLKDPRAAAVQAEIRGHLKELANLEAYYVAHGDVANANKVQGVIDKINILIGVTRDNTKATPASIAATKAAQAATVRAAAVTDQGSRRVANILGTVPAAVNRARTAIAAGAAATATHLSRLEGLNRSTAVNTGLTARKNFSPTLNAQVTVRSTNTFNVNSLATSLVSTYTRVNVGNQYQGKALPS